MSYDSPGRAGTDPVPSSVPIRARDRAQSYLHRRLHSNTIGSSTGKPSHLQRAKDHVQSAIELKPPISFENVLKREKKTESSSRRGSSSTLQRQQQLDLLEAKAAQQSRLEVEARKQVTAQDVDKARAENKTRADALQQRLNGIEETGMAYTHQLDQTYYTMLERAAELRSTIIQLQTLLKSTQSLNRSFSDESTALERETMHSLDAIDSLDEQDKLLGKLITRLQTSKKDTKKLDDRLEAARNRVAVYESRENAANKKRRQQWTATWGTLLGIIAIIVILVLLNNYERVSDQFEDFSKHVLEAGHAVEDVLGPVVAKLTADASPSEDPYLKKLFDEL